MKKFNKRNEIEAAVDKVKTGEMSFDDFIPIFTASELAVPLTQPMAADGSGFDPIVIRRGSDRFIACFTTPAHLDEHEYKRDYLLSSPVRSLLSRLPDGNGITVNPGLASEFDIPANGVTRIVQAMKSLVTSTSQTSSSTTDFVPLNDVEEALMNLMQGRLAARDFMSVFVEAEIAVPSQIPVERDGRFEPLIYDKEGVDMIACFTAKARIGSRAPFSVMTKAIEFLRRLPPDVGVVANPGYTVGFECEPEKIAEIVREFGK